MATLPSEVTTFTLSGKLLRAAPDGVDADVLPDSVALQGQLTFRPEIGNRASDGTLRSGGRVVVASTTPPVTIVVDPVPISLATDGSFSVVLVKGNNPLLNPTGWNWSVTFDLVGAKIPSFVFATPDGATLDLSTVTPVDAGTGAIIVAGPAGPKGDPGIQGIPGAGMTDAALAAALATGAAKTYQNSTFGPSGPDIICWGDSLTAQGYPTTLAATVGRTVWSAGVGGESSQGIAARQGALPYLLLPAGNQIPAAGGVTVTIAAPLATWPLLQGDGIPDDTMRGTLSGISGVLTLTQPSGPSYAHLADDFYTFTRDVAGSAVPVTRPEAFRTTFSEIRRKDVVVIWAGRNNYTSKDRVLADVRAMVRHQTPAQARYLVVGVTNGRLEGTATSGLIAIDALNAALSDEYGRRFIDLRTYLVTYGLADAGIPATAGDTADIAAGIIPNSLRQDAVHLTPAARIVVANLIGKRLKELGWVDTYAPAAYPAPPVAHINLVTNGEVEVNTTAWDGAAGSAISRITTQAFSGLGCIQCIHVTSGSSSARNGSTAKMPVVGGQPITGNVMVKGPLIAGHDIRILLHCYDNTGTGYLTNLNAFVVATGDWQPLSVTGTLPANVAFVVCEVNKSGANQTHTDTVYVDSLEIWQS